MQRTTGSSRLRRPRAGAKRATAAGDTRAKLLQAAGHVFAEAGYHAATIRRISTLAGVNVALVNYHFRDKLGLYLEVLRESVRAARLEFIYDVLGQDAPPEEILRRVVKARLESLSSLELPDRHVRIFIHELAQPSPGLSKVVNEATLPMYNRFRALIGGFLGQPPDSELTRLCTNSILGQVLMYAIAGPMLARLWPGLKMTPAQIDRIADHITNFSLAYLRQVRAENQT